MVYIRDLNFDFDETQGISWWFWWLLMPKSKFFSSFSGTLRKPRLSREQVTSAAKKEGAKGGGWG